MLLPLLLAAGLGACASNAVQPGIVYTSGALLRRPTAAGLTAAGLRPSNGPCTRCTAARAQGSACQRLATGDAGRVVSIREVGLPGAGGGGGGNGALMGGLLGAGAGATIGAITSQTLGGGLVGAVLRRGGRRHCRHHRRYGQRGGGGRGIEVTVQRDDGQQVTVAQRDDGDIQLGDRVQIVQNRQGVAQVVRDNARNPD